MIGRILLQLAILLLFAPLLLGVITKTKALFAGRVGPPLLQPYFDLFRLWRKGFVISRTTTWVFLAGPVVGLVVPLLAAMLIPFGGLGAPISFSGDLILFVYLFGLARFFTAAAALDTGSSFEGMGAAREVTFACLAEPTVLFALLVLARGAGSLALGDLLGPQLAAQWHGNGGASLGLILVCLFVVLLVENSRIPFDDPNTHLELTMIHEVMVLDHSGPAFGMILYGAAMKLLVLGALLVRVALPVQTGSLLLDLLVFLAGLLGLAVLIGVVESTMARLKLPRVPQVLVGTTLLSIFALVLVLR
ncbi:Ech-hydrogenase-related complex, NuoH-like integral membrane subunit [Desulfuromonas sp. DDH964]|uniref:respiratory chain complex I subunit 1 family protein n=1 Tax=Desulfuromonas sp. DDH964 TaxID=1823759 RepID=UPI00078CA526|nr:NADH-quinone oxidoreductase subunit H [Desulfuromonas sp. DDH964]AMV73060.1 Ech-hydrogenase-related complex, NuoH-like integral membrane subunit [Desulfuromonas sp. DDH964]